MMLLSDGAVYNSNFVVPIDLQDAWPSFLLCLAEGRIQCLACPVKRCLTYKLRGLPSRTHGSIDAIVD